MKKHPVIISTIIAILFWVLVAIALLHLTGCTTTRKINWNNHPYDPTQKIDLSLVPDIIP